LAVAAVALAGSVVAAPVVAARVEVGNVQERLLMVAEKNINDFVTRLREAAGTNLASVILYGSAAAGDHVPDLSDTNLLCVLNETSFGPLARLTPAIKDWCNQKNRTPLVMGLEELRRSADVFSIELMDMKQRYRVLWGEDVLSTLIIPTRFHRVQLEYELREKVILLRQGLIGVAGDESRMWELLLRSLPAFATLFRHALLELGEPPTASKREAVQKLAAKVGFDSSAFLQLLDIREHKQDRKTANVNDVFARYLMEIEQVTAAVDRMLDSAA
jgi:predicted nucleotidyltransferase